MRKLIKKLNFKIFLSLLLFFCLIIGLSPVYAIENNLEKVQFILMMADSKEQAPVSEVNFTLYQEESNHEIGSKIGNYKTETNQSGEGRVELSLQPGNYWCQIISTQYQLLEPDRNQMKRFYLSEADQLVVIWLNKIDAMVLEDEIEIEEEEVALGVPNLNSNSSKEESEDKELNKPQTQFDQIATPEKENNEEKEELKQPKIEVEKKDIKQSNFKKEKEVDLDLKSEDEIEIEEEAVPEGIAKKTSNEKSEEKEQRMDKEIRRKDRELEEKGTRYSANIKTHPLYLSNTTILTITTLGMIILGFVGLDIYLRKRS